jgi:diguanylate cyclase (GGDEF)-like protein/PAS domain S-box-containing protein
VEQRAGGVDRLLKELIGEESQIMNGQIDFIKSDPAFMKPFLKEDRPILSEMARPLYERMRSAYRITHFYFHKKDRTCFLRVHSPDRHSDRIGRFTMKGAVSTGKPFHGIELGPLGTFTLRSVHPWTVDGTLLGYIELGMEIDHLTQLIARTLGLEMLVLIQKQYLTRNGWEAGLEVLGRKGDWDLFRDVVIIDGTVETSPGLENILGSYPTGQQSLFSIEKDNRQYMVKRQPLNDAGNRRVGELVSLVDITEAHRNLATLTLLISGFFLVIGGGLMLSFSRYIGGIQKQLILSREHLRSEIEQRRQSENALAASEKRYRSIFEESKDAIVSTDDDGRFQMINPAGIELFGFANIDWRSHGLRDLYIDQAMGRKFSKAIDEKGFVREFGLPLKGKDNRAMECLVTFHSKLSGDGDLTGYEGIVRDVTPFKKMEAELRRLATIDSLTGISNRRHFMEMARKEINRSLRHTHAFSLIMMDIDHFKKINDTHGHATGDRVLMECSRLCTTQLRESDIMGRLGGEEFAIALAECDAKGALIVADRIRKAISSHTVLIDGGAIHFTVSMGVSEFCPADNLDSLLERADSALYKAKKNGRNRVRLNRMKHIDFQETEERQTEPVPHPA